MGYGISLLVFGDYALFTRPEMKAERVSYDVITPSAARGILEAIYWHPGLLWKIDKITVLNKIVFDSIRRNELGSKIPPRKINQAMEGEDVNLHQYIQNDRQQRASLLLRDVAYIIDAHFDVLTEKINQDEVLLNKEEIKKKFYNIFLRRARKGQCFNQAYFGCREFPAFFKLLESDDKRPQSYYLADAHHDLGWILLDIEYRESPQTFIPHFFRAEMKNGVIYVPTEVSL